MAGRKFTMEKAFVYWLHDIDGADPHSHGYIGITVNLRKRFNEHRRSGRFPDSIKITVLFEGPWFECQVREYELRPGRMIGWNIGAGGGKSRLGILHDAATKKKMSLAKIGNKNGLGWCPTEETRERMRVANRNKPIEVKRKGAQKLKGYKHTKEARENMGRSHLGRKVSEETRIKIGTGNAIALLGKKHTLAHRKNQSIGIKKSWTPERRLAQSERMQKRWELK